MIETVIIYKLANLSREEIQAMLHVDDIRKTRVYREAKEEGQKEGRQEERERQVSINRQAVAELAAMGLPAERIARILSLDVTFVRDEMAKYGQAK